MNILQCLFETWLTDNDPIGLYQIEGYQPVENKNRPNKRRGGLAVFVRNDMNYYDEFLNWYRAHGNVSDK